MSSDEPKPFGTLTPPPPAGAGSAESVGHGTVSMPTDPTPPSPHSGARPGDYLPTFAPAELVAGRYRIARFIAKGGMGEVYEAQDEEFSERVALKTVRPEIAERPGTIQRFKREIQLARRVSHPSVCRIFDLGRHKPGAGMPEVLFLTMELLEGQTLRERLKRAGRMAPAQALPLVQAMAAALDAAHDEGIVHRDFKSANVMLVPARGGGGERVLVTDFGLARGAMEDSSVTGTGDIVGTPAYMAPEQVSGAKVGPAADVFALGVVLFEMTTGGMPFPGESPLSIALKRLTEDPVRPTSVAPDLDPAWEATILRCLAREPEQRFERAGDVVRALRGEALPLRRRRPSWRHAGALAAAAALVALGVWLGLARPWASPARPTAPEASPVSAVKLRRSVAVLGFKNAGPPEAAWLSTAIAEMLRTELAAGGAVRTISGESVTRMKLELSLQDQDSLAPETLLRVRDNVGADLVVAGSYLTLPAGGQRRIRLNLSLQETKSGEIVAAAAEEGTEDDVFAIAGRAGERLRKSLGISPLSPADTSAVRASFPSDPVAGQLYAEGLARLRVFDALGARESLEKAAAREPRHPLVQAALASAWSALGHDRKAQQAAGLAQELSKELPREDRLANEGLYHELFGAWDKAIEIYRGLSLLYPDNLDHGLRLAAAQTAAGQGQAALATLQALRRLPVPASTDPRIALAEAGAAKSLTDFERQRRAAADAATAARGQRMQLLFAQARLSECQALNDLGRLDDARAACEEARAIFGAVGDQASAARADNVVAVTLAKRGDLQGARRGFEKALVALRGVGDQKGVARQLNNVAMVDRRLNRRPQARAAYEQARAIARELGDRSGEARALNNLGLVLFEMKDLPGAKRYYEDALKAFQELGEKRNAALAWANLGELLSLQGRFDEARLSYEKAIALERELDARADLAGTLLYLSRLMIQRGNAAEAKSRLEEARELYRKEGDREGEVAALRALADALARLGDSPGEQAARQQADALDARSKSAK
jgi:tetratricopeptide (TPR) repeat protein/TolB-like protein